MAKEMTRAAVVNLVNSWEGLKESDGSHKKIVDIYNSYKGLLPRGLKMKYNWSWCACTWSALAIKLGYTSVMPIEISCYYLIEAAKKMGIWIEDDGAIAGVNRSGTFANKPSASDIYIGFRYFCTDKQTTEGATDGIEIIHKGNNVWVDALGRVVS